MLTIWFMVGAVVATFITAVLYCAARIFNSVLAYFAVLIVPMIFSVIIWGILYVLLDVILWFVAGAAVAILASFITGLTLKYFNPAVAYASVIIIPIIISSICWAILGIFIKLWGAVNV